MLSTLHAPPPAKPARQSHDLSRTDSQNRRHWANADALAAVSAATPAVRETMRRRSRYECLNNPYARGLVTTLAGDVVGTGPRLQMHTADAEFNAFVEARWREWAEETQFTDRLRVMEEARRRDGESFALFARHRGAEAIGLPAVALKPLEADQVAHPFGYSWQTTNGDDGIECDADGEPVRYSVLKVHPGDNRALAGRWEAVTVPAAEMVHWFRADRPGQLRGLPELSSALGLFAYLRRMDLAAVSREELAASISAIIESDMPPGEAEEFEPFEEIPVRQNMGMTLPAGWKMKQYDTNRPGGVHGQFVDTILRAIGRAVNVPFGIVAGDSSRYNYSSARLDYLKYDRGVDADQNLMRPRLIRPLFRRWWSEFQLLYPAALKYDRPPHLWHFDARPSIDPVKDATASEMDLENGRTSLTREVAAGGGDIEDVIRERAKEIEMFRKYGVPVPACLTGGAPTVRPPAQEVPANAP